MSLVVMASLLERIGAQVEEVREEQWHKRILQHIKATRYSPSFLNTSLLRPNGIDGD
jgi:hypothetical protein